MLDASGQLILNLDGGERLSARLDQPAILEAGIDTGATVPLVLSGASRITPAIEDIPVSLIGFGRRGKDRRGPFG
jgi:hypothetical protein